jgi:sarcosine oxidase
MQTCIYTRFPDDDFIIDLHPKEPRIVVASPCSGHGFKFASVIGEILADLSTTMESDYDIRRFSMNRAALSVACQDLSP